MFWKICHASIGQVADACFNLFHAGGIFERRCGRTVGHSVDMIMSGHSPQAVISEDFIIVKVQRKTGTTAGIEILPERDEIRFPVDGYDLEVLERTPVDRRDEITGHASSPESV